MKHIKVKTALKAGRITANHARKAFALEEAAEYEAVGIGRVRCRLRSSLDYAISRKSPPGPSSVNVET